MMDKLKSIVRTVAPTIATALGGPVSGMAVKAIGEAILGKPKPSIKEMVTALTGDADAMLKLKKADQSFEVQMRELDIDVYELDVEDRSSARQREIALKDNAPKALAAVVVVGFFTVLGLIGYYPIPEESRSAVNILLGALTGLLLQVGNYYFGSSKGSSAKNAMMADMLKNR